MPASVDLGVLLSAFASAFQDSNRLIRLLFAPGSGIAEDALLPQRIIAREAISECYQLDIDCLSSDTHLQLKDFLGQAVDISLLLADGAERIISGIVTQTQYLGSDGGFSRYRLQVEPGIAPLAHRQNSRVFQDKTVPEIVALILDEHISTNPVFAHSFRHQAKLDKNYPQRSYCVQYRESDLAFIERLLREEGIAYYFDFTHAPDEVGLHTLVLFDDAYSLDANSQDNIRFHRSAATESSDTITAWRSSRQIQSGAVTLASYDYKPASGLAGNDSSYIDQGDSGGSLAASLEHYDAQSLYYGQNNQDMARLATLRQQAVDMASKTFTGEATVRSLAPGTWFNLTDHPIHDQDTVEQRQFIVLRQEWQAQNNLPDGMRAGEDAPFKTTFSSLRRGIPLVPEYNREYARPTAHGIQTATVVGPSEEEIYTDALGRIKVQLHWQRPQDHQLTGASASFDDKSSCWVRVAYPSAGANWGTQFIPRIGQEVVIDFIEGDIDRPLCTGVLHNGCNPAPTFSQAGSLPNNKTLNGIKTKEYKGSGYNELILDDSTAETRAKLSSEHAKTQLNQGYLIHPRTEGRGEPRGEGFELRTDAAGAIRAPQGLLISGEARNQATGKQLDRQVLMSQLEAAYNQAINQADHAAHQNANKTETGKDEQLIDGASQAGKQKDSGHQAHLKRVVDNLEKGTNTDKTKGQTKTDPQPDKAILALSAPAGIALITPNSLSLATGANLDQVAARDTNQSTARRWIHNVGESISLFVSGNTAKIKHSLKLIAAKGKMQIQAQSDEIEITGDQSLTMTSVNDQILVNAKEHITFVVGGGSYFKLQGGNIEFVCPGNMSVKAGNYSLKGPASLRVPMPAMPLTEPPKNWIELTLLDPDTQEGVAQRPYTITFNDGAKIDGRLKDDGHAKHYNVPEDGVKRVKYHPRDPKKDEPAKPSNKLLD